MKVNTQTALPYKVVKQNADTLTPIAIFSNLEGRKKFLLESSMSHDQKGKYSFMGANPYQEIIGTKGESTILNNIRGTVNIEKKPALSALQTYFPKMDIELPFPFIGGGIGFVGYDAIRSYENLGCELPDDLNMPDVHLMFYKDIIVFDHRNESVYLIAMNLERQDENILDQRINKMKKALTAIQDESITKEENMVFEPEMEKQRFIDNVKKAKKYIQDNEVLQVVLSQRMKAKTNGDPFTFYRKLRRANPSPYMFYIDFHDYIVLGASPESLVQTSGSTIITNPIAGTRPRGKTTLEDEANTKDLLSDKKERSEHDMLVDLSKYDLSRICEKSTISTPTYTAIEKYQHVMHMVSEVRGVLKHNLTSIDALIACLPAGTVSGAPKLKAMQIINGLEDKKRGVYGGGIGYIGFNYDLNMTLTIRSLIIKEKNAYLQVGAGIVADSKPEAEYQETLHKSRSLIEASHYI